jgi:hypothetical protein
MGNAHMILRALVGVLALVAIGEGWYIFSLRNQVNRFRLMDDSGYVAFDRVNETWTHHLRNSDYSRWLRESVRATVGSGTVAAS